MLNIQSAFLERHLSRNKSNGIYVETIEGFSLPDKLSRIHLISHCALQMFMLEREFRFTKGLIAAERVEIVAKKITLRGSAKQPLEIVGLRGIQIDASTVELKNVIFYTGFGNSVGVKNCTRCQNVQIVHVRAEYGVIIEKMASDEQ